MMRKPTRAQMAADHRAKAAAAREAKAEGGGADRAVPRRRAQRDDLRPHHRPGRDARGRAAGRAALAVGGRAVTRSPARLYGLALLAGLPLAILAASSCVAFHYAFDPSLGRPLWWHVYDPFAVVRWAWSWGLAPDYRAGFLSGLSLALWIGLLPAAALRLREMREPLALEERPAGSRLGTAADLRALGAFGHRGPGIVVGLDGRRPLFSDRRRARARARADPDRQGRQQHRARRSSTWPDSALVLDFKGELASVCGPMRDHLGEVFTIDATDPRSARFNPLLAVRTGPEIVTDAQALAHMLVNPDIHVVAGDTVWNDAAALVATALLVTARLSPEPTLGRFHVLLHDLMSGRPIKSPHPWAADLIGRVWKTWHEKTRSSVFFNLESRLGFLASELVRAVLSGDDFRADDLMAADQPVTVFIGTPLRMAEPMRPLHRLLLASFLGSVTASLDHTADGRPKKRSSSCCSTSSRRWAASRPWSATWPTSPATACAPSSAPRTKSQIVQLYGDNHALAANCQLRIYSASLSAKSVERERDLAGNEVTRATRRVARGRWFGKVTSLAGGHDAARRGRRVDAARAGERRRVRARPAPAGRAAEDALLRASALPRAVRRAGRRAVRPLADARGRCRPRPPPPRLAAAAATITSRATRWPR